MFNSNEFNEAKFNSDLLSLLCTETLTMIDGREMMAIISFSENEVLVDNEAQRDLQKGFDEELRLSAWLTIKRINKADWSD